MDKVLWHEGMLLRPQHFQQQDRHLDYEIRSRSSRRERHHWGFFNLELDRQQQVSGQVVIKEASGIFPDGTFFDTAPSRKPLAIHLPPSSGKTTIYLALAAVTGQSVENRRADQEGIVTRYVSGEQRVHDANAGERSECEMMCSHPDYRLVSDHDKEALQGFVFLAIARVENTGSDGIVKMDPEFEPVFLHSHNAPFIRECLNETLNMLAHRGNVLASRMVSRNRLGTTELGDFLMLQMINRIEPVLRHYAATDRVHPEEIHMALCALAGELSTFGNGEKRPGDHVEYLHHDQRHGLVLLLDRIRALLSQVLEEHAIELPLEQRQYGVIVSSLTDKSLLGNSSFIIEARADMSPDVLQRKLPVFLKAGRVETIRNLVNLQLRGLPITPLAVAPRELPYDKRCGYFSLNIAPDEIPEFEESAGFAFHVSGEVDGLVLKLWAIRNQ